MNPSIPYVNLVEQHRAIHAEILEAVKKVICTGQFILGDDVDRFEQAFAALCGVRFAIGVNSGTDALILALRALDVGPNDEVITVPNSFVATASAIALVGARPVFVDVGGDYLIDPSAIERAITTRTKAILPVHLTGRPADMQPILDVAKAHGLHVIEDCAQAVLAEYWHQRVGSFGAVGCFSFHPLKTLNACGDGGVLTLNDASLYEKLRIFRNLGLRSREDCVVWSGNSRLDTMQAAILLVKLRYVAQWTAGRRAHAARYQQALDGIDDVDVPKDRPFETATYHTFVIQARDRDGLRQHLARHGVETAIHYPVPIHLQTAAVTLGYGRGSFPVAERQAERILSLPIYPELATDDVEKVASYIRAFYHV